MSTREKRSALTKSILLICQLVPLSSSPSSISIVAYPTLTPHSCDRMRPFKGLSVDIATQSGPLTLHNDPDDDTSDELYQRYTCQRYVEAVTGATFKVKVSVHKSFPLRRMELDDAVHIEILYDDQKLSWIMDFTRATIMQRRSEGKPVEQTFSQIATFSEETQQWKQGATTFGALDMSKLHCCASRMSDSYCIYRGDCGFPNLLV